MSVLSATGFLNPAQADAYSSALLDLLGDRDPLDVLRGTPASLGRVLDECPAGSIDTPEAPGKWSVRIVLAHLADAELVGAYRMRMILGSDQPALMPYDQDRWARDLHYVRADPRDSLERFSVLRRSNLVIWSESTPEELARFGVHAERGAESIELMRRFYAGHDLAHLRQLARIRAAVANAG